MEYLTSYTFWYIVGVVGVLLIACIKVGSNLKTDFKRRTEPYYIPIVTIRTILLWLLWASIPVINLLIVLLYSIFDLLPLILGHFSDFLSRPLVSRKPPKNMT